MKENDFYISKIVLQNYRQYYNEVVADFGSEKGRFSIFLGENGEGKSNLLNAINWCLFRKEPHRSANKQMPIINNKKLTEVPEGSRIDMRVDLYLNRGSTKYKISRTLVGIKREFQIKIEDKDEYYEIIADPDPVPVGFEIIPHLCSTSFLKSEHGGTYEDKTVKHTFESLINHILPENLSQFFILDGEFLEKLFTEFESIKDGVTQISQIHILENALDHLENAKFGTSLNGYDAKLDEYNKKIEQIDFQLSSKDAQGIISVSSKLIWGESDNFYHSTGKPRIKDLTHASNKLNKKLRDVTTEVHNSNATSNKDLQDKRDELNQTIKEKNIQIGKLLDEHRTNLITIGSKILLKDVLESANNLIGVEIERGTLPNHVKMTFTSDLLERKSCLCGTSLVEGSPARHNVEQIRKQASDDEDLDIANDIKYKNTQFLNEFEKNIKILDERQKNMIDLNISLGKQQEKLGQTNKELKNTSSHDFAKLLEDEENLKNEKMEIDMELGRARQYVENLEADRKNLVHKITNWKTRDKRAKQQQHKIKITELVKDNIKQILSDISPYIRKLVQEKTTEFFKSISWKEGYFDKISIDEEYKLKLLTTEKFNAIDDLSAGERLFLTLSFIAALREITGYKFPLIIDTPFGRISGKPKKLLASKLPDFLPESQITLLATDTEYLASIPNMDGENEKNTFRDLLMKKVNTNESRIQFNTKTFCSNIVPYVEEK